MVLISLTTDFGLRDHYVGVMKGVIAEIAPDAKLVDVTHEIPPQDLRAAAYVLWSSLPYFPADSVHLVVVDPGVGSARRAIASQTAWGVLVAPDNGVCSYVWAAAPPILTVELDNPHYRRAAVSHTFHGRDIFAPAAAYLASGTPLAELGRPVQAPVRLPTPAISVGEVEICGEVIYVDHFGNAVTSIGRLVWDGAMVHLDPAFGEAGRRIVAVGRVTVRAAGRDLGPIRRTYSETSPGEPLALVGSEGMLEIAVNQGSGAQVLELQPGDPVEVIAGR